MYKSIKYSIVCTLVLVVINVTTAFSYYNYNSSNVESINGKSYWTGFKSYHYGFVHPSYAYLGEDAPFSYTYTYIDSSGTHQGISQGSNIALGYGAYAMDYRKHVLGLLYYLKNNMNESDNYTTQFTKLESPDPTLEPIEVPVKMKEACTIVAGGITLSSYGNKYKNETFNDFWHKCFTSDKANLLLNYENKFYARVYAENAISYLRDTFGLNTTGLPSNVVSAVNGAVFSIVEGRYRNKNLGGKTNQQLKVAAGEVLPFLLYFDCKYVDSGEVRTYTNIVPPKKDGKLDIDKIIDGAYQYMVYYFGSEGTSSSNKTALSSIDTEEDDDEDLPYDYVEEYEDLTNRTFPYLHGKDLETFLQRVSEKSAIYRKSRDNSYGTFGMDEEYNIESYINYSEAMTNMKNAIVNTVGVEAFTGMQGEENIARTYLMAKNIVDSYKERDELSYYDIGTNVILKTPGLDGNIYLLSDFQKVDLEEPLEIKDDNQKTIKTYADTDDDGIFDRNELNGTVDIVIDEFVRQTLYYDLFGKDPKDITPEQKALQDNQINIILGQYKQKVKADFATKRSNNEDEYEFYVNRANELTVTAYKYRSNPTLKDTDFDGIDDGKGTDALDKLLETKEDKNITYLEMRNDERPLSNHFEGRMNSTRLSGNEAIEVDMNMDYRYFLMSNQNYYDELSTMSLLMANSIYKRGENQDKHSGVTIFEERNTCTTEEKDHKGWEAMSKNGVDYKNLRIKRLMEFFGFQNVKVYYLGSSSDEGYDREDSDLTGNTPICRNYTDTHKGSVAIGYHNIEYHGIEKSVVGIVIRGTAEDDDWDNDFDMGDLDLRNAMIDNVEPGKANFDQNRSEVDKVIKNIDKYDNQYLTELAHFAYGYPDWLHQYHHAGFDIVANRILEIVDEYLNSSDADDMEGNICYWITGHSMGAGVANIVAAELLHGSSGINDQTDNVYCYTFAAPNTFYLTDNINERESNAIPGKQVTETYREPKTTKYRCIFNIVNSDDFVPRLPMSECNWTKYGRTAAYSIEINDKNLLSHLQSNSGNSRYTGYKKYIAELYKSDVNGVGKLIRKLSDIYSYTNAMRYSTYTSDKNDNKIKVSKISIDSILNTNKNARPYQTYSSVNIPLTSINIPLNIGFANVQEQMPAYFMQCIAHCQHTYLDDDAVASWATKNLKGIVFKDANGIYKVKYDNKEYNVNQAIFKFTIVAKEFNEAKSTLVDTADNIQYPHYPESYYSLTKEISVTDFDRKDEYYE